MRDGQYFEAAAMLAPEWSLYFVYGAESEAFYFFGPACVILLRKELEMAAERSILFILFIKEIQRLKKMDN